MKTNLDSENFFLQGAIAGSISAAIICLFMEMFEMTGLPMKCWLFMAGQPIMQFKHTFWQSILAFLVHLGVGAFWGVIIALLLAKVFTAKHYLLKGVVMGNAIFFFHLGILNNAFHYPPQLRENTLTLFLMFVSYILYGGSVSLLLQKLPRRVRGTHSP